MRMAGQMGNVKVKVQNLRVVKVVPEKNLLVVKGCVPGHKNAYVIVQKIMELNVLNIEGKRNRKKDQA